MTDPDQCPTCQHRRADHIYGEGACRPGFTCWAACTEFGPKGDPPSVALTEAEFARVFNRIAAEAYDEGHAAGVAFYRDYPSSEFKNPYREAGEPRT